MLRTLLMLGVFGQLGGGLTLRPLCAIAFPVHCLLWCPWKGGSFLIGAQPIIHRVLGVIGILCSACAVVANSLACTFSRVL